MDIPLNVEVNCSDGNCGRSTNLILDPKTKAVTHLVVKGSAFPGVERLVPINLIYKSTPARISLRCSTDEFSKMDHFVQDSFPNPNNTAIGDNTLLLWEYSLPNPPGADYTIEEKTPPGELAIRQGVRVNATDGDIGQVDEFLVDPGNGRITHIILREGHLWGQKRVTIPVAQIDRIDQGSVHLKLDKHAVGSLPTMPASKSGIESS